jgi:hypothetical protein
MRRFMRFLEVQTLEVGEAIKERSDLAWLGEV